MSLAAAVALTCGCGGGSCKLVEVTGDLEATHLVHDLVDRAGSAAIIRETAVLDAGSPDSTDAWISGWGDPEAHTATGGSFVWAVSDHAVIESVLFQTGPTDLVFRCRPFEWDGAPVQTLRVSMNERDVGEFELTPGFSDHFVAVPEGVLGVGRNRIDLRFSWAVSPAASRPGSTDARTLAAAFERIEFRSRPGGRARTSATARPRAEHEQLVLPPGTGLRFTLPVPADAVLDLGVSPSADGAEIPRVMVWVTTPGKPASRTVVLDPGHDNGKRYRFEIGAGAIVEIGMAAIGGGLNDEAVVIHTPRILSGTEGSREIASVLLIVVDTLRADYLGAYGADVHTPHIDALAAGGVRFSRARSHIPITGPSHVSLFTSLLPMEHGVLNNAQIMGEGFPTLAEALRNAGRQTAGIISLGVMQGDFGFERGFDHYGDEFPRDWLKDAGEVTDEALELADSSVRGPYFLWVHYSDPHEPYAPTNETYPVFDLRLDGHSIGRIDAGGRGFRFDLEVPAGNSVLEFAPLDEGEQGRVYRVDNLLLDESSIGIEALDGWHVIPRRMGRTTYESEFPATVRLSNPSGAVTKTGMLVSCKKLLHKPEIREAYAGETEFVDLQIGRLLAGLEAGGLMDNTLVIFASDHGEGLGDHNHVGHISQVYDSLLQVPLILTWPGRLPAGKVIDEPVGLVDVFPTAADLLGLETPAVASGVSLVPLIRDEVVAERALIAATYRPESFSDKRAIVLDGFKYIHSWKDENEWEELYDLAADPGELENLSEARPEVIDKLRAELGRRLAAMNENAPVDVELSDEDRAHLRALGYIH